MKTLTKTKIAYYMFVFIIVFALMLQDTLGKNQVDFCFIITE